MTARNHDTNRQGSRKFTQYHFELRRTLRDGNTFIQYLGEPVSLNVSWENGTVIIAIDGPAGSGKSSTAREVARRLGALFIDTGAMYRAVALKSIASGIDPDSPAFGALLEGTEVGLITHDGGTLVILDGEDVTSRIRTEEVSRMASRVSRRPDVRDRMVALQRRVAHDHVTQGGTVVMEGRDIGSVVFPNADFKFFVTASPEIRAERRARELRQRGEAVDLEILLRELTQRDARDSKRAVAPLVQAEDAIRIDTSERSFEDQVESILHVIAGNAAG